jgi:hypothetical protein
MPRVFRRWHNGGNFGTGGQARGWNPSGVAVSLGTATGRALLRRLVATLDGRPYQIAFLRAVHGINFAQRGRVDWRFTVRDCRLE